MSGVGEEAELRLHDVREPMDFLPDASIDVVLSSLTIEYVEHLEPVSSEFRRVLREGGRLVLSTHLPFGDWEAFGLPNYYAGRSRTPGPPTACFTPSTDARWKISSKP